MAVRKLNPVTPGTRHKVITDFEGITTNVPEPSLTQGRVKSGGRNNQGKMTMRYIGGGHKQRYRSIDSKRDKHGINGTVGLGRCTSGRGRRRRSRRAACGSWVEPAEVGEQRLA